MKEFRVEYTEQENNYTFSGMWAAEIVEAETAGEAIELLKQHFTDNGGDPDDYIYRAKAFVVWKEYCEFDRCEKRNYAADELIKFYHDMNNFAPVLIEEFGSIEEAEAEAAQTPKTTTCRTNSLSSIYINIFAEVVYIEEVVVYELEEFYSVCNWSELVDPLNIED